MAEGWLEIGLSQSGNWHVSSLETPSRPLGGAPTSVRVVAAASDPLSLSPGERTRESQLFVPRITPIALVLATPAPYAGAPSSAVRSRLQELMRTPVALVTVDLVAPYDAVKSVAVQENFDGAPGGTGADLAEKIAEMAAERGVLTDANARLQKPLNTGRVNDPLHLWSRELLSSDLVVNDIDAFCFTGRGGAFGLIEIKRSGVTPWTPYRNDARNYALLRSMSLGSARAAFDLVIHYDHKRTVSPYVVNFHSVVGLSGWAAAIDPTRTVGRLEHRVEADTTEEAVDMTDNWVQEWLRRGYWSAN